MDQTPRGSTPVPDPTELTDKAIAKLKEQLEQFIEGKVALLTTRLGAMDTATKLNKEQMDKIPSLITERIHATEEVQRGQFETVEEKFRSIGTQFKERDIRAEREARDNKVAVDAAFAAQKEAAAKQDEANAKAIEKSERATAETIKTNQELSLSKIDALTNQMTDLKGRLDRGEGVKAQAVENKGQQNWQTSAVIAGVSLLISLGVLIVLVLHK
jgi:hypothetical protein